MDANFKLNRSCWSYQWFTVDDIHSNFLEAYKICINNNADTWINKCKKYEDTFILVCCQDYIPVLFLTALVDNKSNTVLIYETHVSNLKIPEIRNKNIFINNKIDWMLSIVNETFANYTILK